MMQKISLRLSLFIMIVLIMVQGCTAAEYLTFHGDAGRTGYVADAGPLSENIRWSVSPGYIDASPVVAGDHVYIATIADWNHPEVLPGVFCYNTTTGAEVWSYAAASECGLTIAGDLLIVGGADGYISALDIADGSLTWSVQADADAGYFGLSSSPLYYDGLIYLLTPSDGGMHVYAPADGSEVWSVAFGDWDIGWTNTTYFTAPAAADGVVYFPSNCTVLYAYNTATQAEIWNTTLDATIQSAPVIDTASLFVTTATTLYEVSRADGSITASRTIGGTTATPALNSTAGLIYVGTDDGLLCLDSGNIEAALVWQAATAKISSSPVVAGEYVYAATNEEQSSLYAFSAATGSDVWSYTLPAPQGGNYAAFFGSSPAVADGTLYIGAEYTNTLFAFGPGAAYETTVILQEGEKVSLTDGTFVNETTAAGALHAASAACGFSIDTSTGDWGSSLNLLGDMGYDAGTGKWWQQFNNSVSSNGGLDDVAHDGDTFSFWYSGWGDTLPAETNGVSNLVTVHVSVLSEDIGAFTIADTSVARGSSFLARLNVIKADAGWYVIDVSGVDSEGNSLSGLATVELAASTTKTGIPVHVQVPLNAPTGEYELFAAVYTFDTFPYTKPVISEGIACTVL